MCQLLSVSQSVIFLPEKSPLLNYLLGATVNSENEYQSWVKSGGQHDDVDLDELLETTTTAGNTDDEESVTVATEEEVKLTDEPTKEESPSNEQKLRNGADKSETVEEESGNKSESKDESTTEPNTTKDEQDDSESATTAAASEDKETNEDDKKSEKSDIKDADKSGDESIETSGSLEKGGKQGKVSEYNFDGPFLWFLHATNDEPLFMGVVESFETYKEVPRWLRDTTRGLLWRCPAFE